MPETACRISSDPSVEAAWEACNASETKLETQPLANPAFEPLAVDAIGTTYFVEAGRMLAAPTYTDGGVDRDSAVHRTDYEGMDAERLLKIALSVEVALLATTRA